MSTTTKIDKVTQLKRFLAGKKGSITKRTNELNRMVSEGGSRTKIRFLHNQLLKVFEAVTEIQNEIGEISELTIDDIKWMEDVSHTVYQSMYSRCYGLS